MSELRIERLLLPAACLGGENPLPALLAPPSGNAPLGVEDDVPQEDGRYIGYGAFAPVLPYRLQDQYDRRLQQRSFPVAVLENEHLRATFMLELGGRLRSLWHKGAGRELLYVNPIFQPANLAIRNAWFSGGVEWNMSMIGHHPFTCAPLFAARATGPDGAPALRMWEWERGRGLLFQIDAYLPDASPFLKVHIQLVNPSQETIPSYWWSNMAVPEHPEHRVLTPATWALSFNYQNKLARVPIPTGSKHGTDVSYPTNLPFANDFFFRIPDGQRPWIASLDRQGAGLVQTSTAVLKGRKLFVWGTGPGGRRWQDFLSKPGQPYVEIQAGLARTQAECLPMPAGARWSWLEAYGLIQADSTHVHGADWAQALAAVESPLERNLPRAQLEAELIRADAAAALPVGELLQRGSGWGALEETRRRFDCLPAMSNSAAPFDPATLGPEQAPWLALLESGELPAAVPLETPVSWMIQQPYAQRLESAIAQGRGDHWLSWLHLGIMRYTAGDRAGAAQAWERSLAHASSPWSLRGLAILAREDQNPARAADLWLEAQRLRPDLLPLAVECCQALLQAQRPRQVLELLEQAGNNWAACDRLQLYRAQALVDVGDFQAAEPALLALELVTLREGEGALTDLWFTIQERLLAQREGVAIDDALKQRVRRELPPPPALDFRMTGG